MSSPGTSIPAAFESSCENFQIASKARRPFGSQDWRFVPAGEFTREELQAFTGQLDLDREEFKSCLRDPELANQLRANVREAEESAIKNPPGFLLGLTDQDDPETVMVTRYLEGPPQFTDLQTAIDELLEQAGASN
jgi:protein-disulfide isomerase